jgi:hypothetical protein
MKTPTSSRNGANAPDATTARDPPSLARQLAFARCELVMARVDAQPAWWLNRSPPDRASQAGYRLACLEAIYATLARCYAHEQKALETQHQGRLATQERPRGGRMNARENNKKKLTSLVTRKDT